MVRCAVEGCTNYQGKERSNLNKRFFCFPKDRTLCSKWITLCGGFVQINPKIARVCSDHFSEKDWRLQDVLLNISDGKKRLKYGALPTQKLPMNIETDNVGEAKRLKIEDPTSCEEYFTPTEVGSVCREGRTSMKVHIDTTDTVQTELDALRMDNKRLREEACDLLRRVKKSEAVVLSMEAIFTKGQIRRLMNPLKKCNWNYEEIANSITLFTASPLMYQIMYQMLWRKKFPLPSPSTLRKWAATLKLRPGILVSTIKVLAGIHFEQKDRLCVLSFYEIRLKKPARTDEPADSGLRPYKYAQMFIVRGLVNDWKQIIYYNFDCMLPGLVMKNIVRALREIHYTVVAAVTGVGPRKLSLWRELQVDEKHPFFEVFDNESVFVFANVPHLIKRLRNKFIERGFLINEKRITVEPLKQMLAVEPSELWVSHDLTQRHISHKMIGQHSHHAVTQLFSQSVGESIRKCVAMGKMNSPCAIECSDFIQLVDKWVNVFNSKHTNLDGEHHRPYGMALDRQNSIISSMNEAMKSLRVIGSQESIQSFQEGILLNNYALPLFLAYIKEKYNVSYIITNNLNSDDIEHSFGIRKSHGGIAIKPTPLEFKYRLRAGIFANLTEANLLLNK